MIQTTQGNRLSCRDQEGRRGSEEAVPGPSVFPSGEPGVSGDFWVGFRSLGVAEADLNPKERKGADEGRHRGEENVPGACSLYRSSVNDDSFSGETP